MVGALRKRLLCCWKVVRFYQDRAFLLLFPRFGQQEKSIQGRIQKIHRVGAEEIVTEGKPPPSPPPN